MGLNINIRPMLDLPATVGCPNCKAPIDPQFEDYDIESPGLNPSPGIWKLYVHCEKCEHAYHFFYRVGIQLQAVEPLD